MELDEQPIVDHTAECFGAVVTPVQVCNKYELWAGLCIPHLVVSTWEHETDTVYIWHSKRVHLSYSWCHEVNVSVFKDGTDMVS